MKDFLRHGELFDLEGNLNEKREDRSTPARIGDELGKGDIE